MVVSNILISRFIIRYTSCCMRIYLLKLLLHYSCIVPQFIAIFRTMMKCNSMSIPFYYHSTNSLDRIKKSQQFFQFFSPLLTPKYTNQRNIAHNSMFFQSSNLHQFSFQPNVTNNFANNA